MMEYCLVKFIEELMELKELVRLYQKGKYDEFVSKHCILPLQKNKQLACIHFIEAACNRTVSRWSTGKYEDPDTVVYWRHWVWIQDTRHNFVGREKARIRDEQTET